MTSRVALGPLGLKALDALVLGDLELASIAIGVPLPEFFLDERWLWQIRLDQVLADERDEPWVAWLATIDGEVVGHTGFHGRPDSEGVVEVSYTVLPERRGQGHAREMVEALLAFCAESPAVSSVVASVSPSNAASLAVLEAHGFERVGEQIDDVDGLEYVFRRPA
ncbi:GNAT family N-acetyltransferase [Frigoribacterium sp. 2-23]|uniref:GNAT family N-acetyltransferase n=1 Tax=Frigoribacterium sp. 2-23 TaxID=3415006 RepID=UPI003C6F8EF8